MGHLSEILVLERVKGHLRRNLGDLLFQFTEEENECFEVFGKEWKECEGKLLGEGKGNFLRKEYDGMVEVKLALM